MKNKCVTFFDVDSKEKPDSSNNFWKTYDNTEKNTVNPLVNSCQPYHTVKNKIYICHKCSKNIEGSIFSMNFNSDDYVCGKCFIEENKDTDEKW